MSGPRTIHHATSWSWFGLGWQDSVERLKSKLVI
jgi:hypothetical protein